MQNGILYFLDQIRTHSCVLFFFFLTRIKVRDEPKCRILYLITIVKRCYNLESVRYTVEAKIIARLKRIANEMFFY